MRPGLSGQRFTMDMEIIDQMVVLMEELADDEPDKSDDPVRNLYGVHLVLGRAVGDRMHELNVAKKQRAEAG